MGLAIYRHRLWDGNTPYCQIDFTKTGSTNMSALKTHFHIQKTQLNLPAEKAWEALSNISTLSRLTPPWLKLTLNAGANEITEGAMFEIQIHRGVLAGTWKARVSSMRKGFLIGFELLSPSQRTWVVWTKVLPADTDGRCIIEDRVEFNSSALLGKTSARIENTIREIIYFRHRTLKSDLNSLGSLISSNHQKIVIAGGSGLVGRNLSKLLKMRGHHVQWLSTKVQEGTLHWDPEKGMIDPEHFEGIDTVVNLAGFPIACRWNKLNRNHILESRIKSTHQLVKTLLRLDTPPKQLIQASATGYYGYENQNPVDEDHARGNGFLAEVCEKWEAQLNPLDHSDIHKKIVRLGVVLSSEGGALSKMLPAFKLGLGGKLGNGKQYFPWISNNDLSRLLVFLIEKPDLVGTFNACVPEVPTNAEFTKALSDTIQRPAFFPVPGFVLKTLFGQMATEALLGGIGAEPRALMNAGFQFHDGNLEEAFSMNLGSM